jgi:hypothetical protein
MRPQNDISLISNNIATETVSKSKDLHPSVRDQKRELRRKILAVHAGQQVFVVDSACGSWLAASGDWPASRPRRCANETFLTGRRVPRDT